jgi:hypothetical protein
MAVRSAPATTGLRGSQAPLTRIDDYHNQNRRLMERHHQQPPHESIAIVMSATDMSVR